MPAGNRSLIGSEVERDQLALSELSEKRGCIRQKWKKKEDLERKGGSVPVCGKKKTVGYY